MFLFFVVRYCMRTEKAHFTVKSSKTSVSEIFRATENLIIALDPLFTLNVKITFNYQLIIKFKLHLERGYLKGGEG